MSRKSNPWPDCPDPEHEFASAILLVGPLPPTGWSVTRRPDKSPYYVTPRGKAAREFHHKVIQHFKERAKKYYGHYGYSDRHYENIGRRWKNAFYLWLWERVDEEYPTARSA